MSVKIAGAQIDVAFERPSENLERLCDVCNTCCDAGAKLIIFPECALTGYCFDSFEQAAAVAEPIPGPSSNRVAHICRERNCYAIFGLLELDGERLFNAVAVVGPDGLVGSYRKIHLPHLGVDRFVTPGDRPFAVYDLGGLRVGVNICYDGSFPESARALALQGADLIALPTNWPPGAECAAEHMIATRAMENRVYYAAINRIGHESGFDFIGCSQIADVNGSPLAVAKHAKEEILYAEIDPQRARDKHIIRVAGEHEIHRFADRRPEMYGDLVAKWK